MYLEQLTCVSMFNLFDFNVGALDFFICMICRKNMDYFLNFSRGPANILISIKALYDNFFRIGRINLMQR